MKTALLSFILALVAPLAHAANCPSQSTAWNWAQFDVTIHLSQATPPSADLLWQVGPDAPTPSSFSFDSAPDSVRAESDTATAWKFFYNSLDYRRTAHEQLTCQQLYDAMVIAARSGLHIGSIFQIEAEAFWDAYFADVPNRASWFLAHPVGITLYQYTMEGDYPAQDIADMLAVFGL